MPAPGYDGGVQVAAVGRQYELVAANQANQIMGSAGATGDTIDGIWIFPTTTTPGVVTVLDDAVQVWSMSGVTLNSTMPIFVPLNLRSVNGAWKVTTGASVSVLAFGQWN